MPTRRAARLIMVLVLALAACSAQPVGLSPDAQSRLAGRVVVTAESDVADPRRAAATVANPTPLTAPLTGTLVSVLGGVNESSRTRVGRAPLPGTDPARLVRSILVDHLVASQGALRGIRPLDATGVVAATPSGRAAELFARARLQGFPGVIVDVHPTAFRLRSQGVGLGLRAEAFYLEFEADFVLVDAADGRVIAQARCEGSSRSQSRTLAQIEANGSSELEAASDLAAQQCAASIIARTLAPRS